MIYNSIMEENECEYGIENCSEDDFENMCDDHLRDYGEQREQDMRDTYD